MVAEDQDDKTISVLRILTFCPKSVRIEDGARAVEAAFIELNQTSTVSYLWNELTLKRTRLCAFHRKIAAVSHKHSLGILSGPKQFTEKFIALILYRSKAN